MRCFGGVAEKILPHHLRTLIYISSFLLGHTKEKKDNYMISVSIFILSKTIMYYFLFLYEQLEFMSHRGIGPVCTLNCNNLKVKQE